MATTHIIQGKQYYLLTYDERDQLRQNGSCRNCAFDKTDCALAHCTQGSHFVKATPEWTTRLAVARLTGKLE